MTAEQPQPLPGRTEVVTFPDGSKHEVQMVTPQEAEAYFGQPVKLGPAIEDSKAQAEMSKGEAKAPPPNKPAEPENSAAEPI